MYSNYHDLSSWLVLECLVYFSKAQNNTLFSYFAHVFHLARRNTHLCHAREIC